MLSHASALLGFVVPWVFHVLGPLIVWLAKRADSPEIDAHGRESLNFQISMLIYNLVAGVLCLVLIGFVLLLRSPYPESGPGHRRLDPGQRRQTLPLPSYHPPHVALLEGLLGKALRRWAADDL